jgi:N-acyl-D-aspartate/D-glutamate deacylase
VGRTVFTNGLVFDGSGTPPAPGEVTLDGDRVVAVTTGWPTEVIVRDKIRAGQRARARCGGSRPRP